MTTLTVTAPAYLARLNDAQREAATHGIGPGGVSDPLLIIAGAGTGKTATLAHRVAHLLAHGADPDRLLLLTFSRRAADEMTRRVQRIAAQVSPRHATLVSEGFAWAGTFHSVGARLLREYAGRIGLDPAFTIHDREDSADLMNLVRHDLALSSQGKRFPLKGTCLAIYSSAVNTQSDLGEILQSTFPWCSEWEAELKTLFLGYVEAKQPQQVLDYDDLLLYWAQMACDPDIAAELGRRFPHVLVDEYQDTNHLQASLLLAMKPDGRGLTVVGDDAQSIYRFRGATVRNILDYPRQFDPPARIITLDRNYRSTQPILAAANAVIADAKERYTKDLWSERASARRPQLISVRDEVDQATYVAEQTLARRERGTALKAQAVLFRSASHSVRLEIELTRRNLPFVKFGGLKFLEARHVKDVLALLRWAQNLRDRVAGFRALQLLPGIGPKTASRLLDNIQSAPPGATLLAEQPVPEAARTDWRNLVAALEGAGQSTPTAWPLPLEQLARWYDTRMDGLFEDADVRRADIQQLVRIAATGSAEAIADVLRGKPTPTIAAVVPSIWNEDECGEELLPAHFHAIKDVSNAVFPLATASRRTATSLHQRQNVSNRAANSFERLYHAITKPIFGRGFVTWDLEDAVSTLSQEGASAFGFGLASGEHAFETATLRAIASDSLGRRRLFSASAIFAHLEGCDRVPRGGVRRGR